MENTAKRTPADYAKNYPIVQADGFYGPFTVGNIKRNFNGRTIINVCVKTPQSGEVGATYSAPDEWPVSTRFATGDQVNITVVDGYIKKLTEAKAKAGISAAAVNKAVQDAEKETLEQSDETQSEGVKEDVTSETASEDMPF